MHRHRSPSARRTERQENIREAQAQVGNRNAELRRRVDGTLAYSIAKGWARLGDKYMIDPLIGLFFEGVGDVVSLVMGLVTLDVAVRLRSVRLGLCMLFNILLDFIIGCVPVLGDLLDFFHRAYQRNLRLIEGYIDDDPAVMATLNRSTALALVGCVVLVGLGVLAFWLLADFLHWLSAGLSGLF